MKRRGIFIEERERERKRNMLVDRRAGNESETVKENSNRKMPIVICSINYSLDIARPWLMNGHLLRPIKLPAWSL